MTVATGINVTQLKQDVIEPVLQLLPLPYSLAAVNLLAGTALVESNAGEYLKQLGGGPAVGIFQMEQATHDDCYNTFLNYISHSELKHAVISFLAAEPVLPMDQMAGNLFYAAAMCRIKYFRCPTPLPNATDALGLATYHKTWYNTAAGATQVSQSELLFQQAISA
jgi:hypothetical protein